MKNILKSIGTDIQFAVAKKSIDIVIGGTTYKSHYATIENRKKVIAATDDSDIVVTINRFERTYLLSSEMINDYDFSRFYILLVTDKGNFYVGITASNLMTYVFGTTAIGNDGNLKDTISLYVTGSSLVFAKEEHYSHALIETTMDELEIGKFYQYRKKPAVYLGLYNDNSKIHVFAESDSFYTPKITVNFEQEFSFLSSEVVINDKQLTPFNTENEHGSTSYYQYAFEVDDINAVLSLKYHDTSRFTPKSCHKAELVVKHKQYGYFSEHRVQRPSNIYALNEEIYKPLSERELLLVAKAVSYSSMRVRGYNGCNDHTRIELI